MMKFVLLVVVIGLALWMFMARRRGGDATRGDAAPPAPPPTAAAPMLACAHCGVHLPQADALTDAAGRAFCTEAHRLAGPR